ncbi:DUF3573 domain-containing protein [Francisella frigiditurris]|uniref:DUF3573 domain-containing protein n=1 Tax=Francisella frigiditurris TaxID=1542390 RepID=A0A1J0KSX7_9GAMM|nr:DUF3573 domain-containing protein [Francisella frigiditurris]APC96869.1 hypothetical protein KX01_15 [Francisella frigiditurris]
MSRKNSQLIKIFFLLFFLFHINFAISEPSSEQTNKQAQLDAIIALQQQINELSSEISDYNVKETYGAENIGITLGKSKPVASKFETDVDFARNAGLNEALANTLNADDTGPAIQSVNTVDDVPITTQGQVSYIGSYTSNNTIPIGQLPSNLFAASILNQRNNFDDVALFFGGFIEVDAQAWSGSAISKRGGGAYNQNGENIYVTAATLYFVSNISHFVTAEFDFTTSESADLGLQDALVIFGNLDSSPWFVTVGKYRISVGAFGGGGPWTSGITANLFRPDRVANAAINYKGSTSNANVTVYNSGDHPSFSLGYFDAISVMDSVQAGWNVGYMYDLHGAKGAFKNIQGRVGSLNVDGTLNFSNILPGRLSFGAGWASTTNTSTQFNGYSDSYAGAWYVSSAYGFDFLGRGTNVNFSYGQTYNANNLPMGLSAEAGGIVPASGIQHQYLISAQRAYFDDNVLFGPEYSYQNLYNGQHMNTFTLDISVYV